jgi:hypothetical protein
MKFWQAITLSETDQLIEVARFAEEPGFHGLMSGNHAVYPETIAPDYPYSDNGMTLVLSSTETSGPRLWMPPLTITQTTALAIAWSPAPPVM